MRITQKDISRELGISLITVSRALNNTGYVSRELKRRILDYAAEKNYVPHRASQVLVRNKTHRVAMFSSSLPSYFWGDIRKGVDVAAGQIEPFNYDVEYFCIGESDYSSYLTAVRAEIEKGVEAFAFVNQRLYDMAELFDMVERSGIPYITFNVDAPQSRRLCYVGTDYQAGGRLAAEFLGKALSFCESPRVLVISSVEPENRFSDAPDINGERLKGFLSVIRESFPAIRSEVVHITTKLQAGHVDSQIVDVLREHRGRVEAVYMIPAFNVTFLNALQELRYERTLTVLHDLDSSSSHHLETHLLSAVVYQNPILQGYYTVKTLEHIVEFENREALEGTEIVSNLIFAENHDLYRNHYQLIR